VPYDLVNYAAGLAPIRRFSFVVATAIGASTRAFAYTAPGGWLGDLSSPEVIVAIGLEVMVAAGLVLARRQAARARS
jgi:uncharacterized membrane protein YdjX (TVP38/TMEM64 family)